MAERVAASRLPRRGAAGAAATGAEHLQPVFGSRLLAYLIDSLILAILAIAFVSVASLTLLLQTDAGFADVSDSALWTFVYICLASIPAWFVLTLALLLRRGQTLGQYIVGLAVTRDDGANPSLPQLALYLAAGHPLVFHPVIGAFWLLAALTSISAVASYVVLIGLTAMALLCLVAPLIAAASSAGDGGRRALHDRIAGTVVVRVE